jgi:hypothetical protein
MKNVEFIHKLPSDILSQIIPYTYNTQSKELLQDIVNYTKIKRQLLQVYFDFWVIDREEPEPEDKNWLINDIILYANNDIATMLGYVDKFYNICKRNIQLQTNYHVDRYISILENKNVSTQINVFLGLLYPHERDLFFYSYHLYYSSVYV